MCPLHLVPVAEANALQEYLQNVVMREASTEEEEQKQDLGQSDFFESLQRILQDDALINAIVDQACTLLFALPAPMKEASDRLKRFTRRMCTPAAAKSTALEFVAKPPSDEAATAGSRRRSNAAARNQEAMIARARYVGDDCSAAHFALYLRNESAAYNNAVLLLGRRLQVLSSASGVRSYVLHSADAFIQLEDAPWNMCALAERASRRKSFLSDVQDLASARIVQPQFVARLPCSTSGDPLEHWYDSLSVGHIGECASPEPLIDSQQHLQDRFDMLTDTQAAIVGLSNSKMPAAPVVYQLPLSLQLLSFPASLFCALQCEGRKERKVYLRSTRDGDSGGADTLLGFFEGQVNASLKIGPQEFRIYHGPESSSARAGHIELVRPVGGVESMAPSEEATACLICTRFACGGDL